MKMIRAVMLAVVLGLASATTIGIAWASEPEPETATAEPTTSTSAEDPKSERIIATTTTVPPTTTTTTIPPTTTTPPPPPPPAPEETAPPSGDIWAALAQCEAWGTNANTGNGYYGYFQFSPGTWTSVGGSGLPTDHDYATQLHFAQILQARSGWGQWPACSAKLGLR